MRAVVCERYGPPEVLRFKVLEKPVPREDEILVRLRATTVTVADVRVRGFRVPKSFWLPARLALGLFRPKCRILGAERAFDYAKAGFADELETYDAIFVAIDKLPFSECLKRLKPGGTYLNVTAPLKSLPMLFASLSVSKGKIFTGETIPRDKEDLSILKDLLEAGRIKPVIDRTFPFERIADAHRYVDLGHKRGNVAVTIP